MRETLSKRPRVIAKAIAKTVKNAAVSAKAKLRSTPKPKSFSVSKPPIRTAAKTKSATTKPSNPTKKLAVAKKTAAKSAKPIANKNAPAKIMAKGKDSAVKAKPAKIKETKVKAKVKVKVPNQVAVSSKPAPSPKVRVQPAVRTQSIKPVGKTAGKTAGKTVGKTAGKPVGKTITKAKRKPAPPIPAALPPVPEPPRRSVTSGALRTFEHAVRIFNRRHFEEAKSLFDALLSKFPAEVELNARAQMYIQVCSQKLAHVETSPRNADELYDHGVYALNIGDFTQAKTFFEKALRLKPDEAHLLYSLAATHAQTGSMDQALDYLKRTIKVQPRYRFQALNDSDFSVLRENKQFRELIGLASPFDLLQSRR